MSCRLHVAADHAIQNISTRDIEVLIGNFGTSSPILAQGREPQPTEDGNMKQIHLLAMTLSLLPAVAANAQGPGGQIQQTGYGPVKQKFQQVGDAVAEAYAAQHVYANTYAGHSYQGGAGAYHHAGASCPPNYYGGQYCRGYGEDLNCYPRHNYTYGYQRPRHLVYPQPQATGGAVVYPYYTHKGPSDFFRK